MKSLVRMVLLSCILTLAACQPQWEGDTDYSYISMPEEVPQEFYKQNYTELDDTLVIWGNRYNYNGLHWGEIFLLDIHGGGVVAHQVFDQEIHRVRASGERNYEVMLPEKSQVFAVADPPQLLSELTMPEVAEYGYDHDPTGQRRVYVDQEGVFVADSEGEKRLLTQENAVLLLNEVSFNEVGYPPEAMPYFHSPRILGDGQFIALAISSKMSQYPVIGLTLINLENNETVTYNDDEMKGGNMIYPDGHTIIITPDQIREQSIKLIHLPDTRIETRPVNKIERGNLTISLDGQYLIFERIKEDDDGNWYSVISLSSLDNPQREKVVRSLDQTALVRALIDDTFVLETN